jgi:hypothetical protein
MGVVFLASAPDGGLVSVKTLRPWLVGGEDGRRRFEREVSTLLRVRGTRVAEVIDADINADPPYIVTRYVDGVPLASLIITEQPLQGAALYQLARGLLDAIGSVHAAGVIHRDVKPANVLMSTNGPVLIDFGIAYASEDTRLTATGFVAGTPGYLAPETVIGHSPTPATDVHGWAATLVFAATGRPPYGNGPDVAVFDRIRRGEHDLRGVDPGLSVVLTAALNVNPLTRPTVGEARQALAEPDEVQTVAIPPIPLSMQQPTTVGPNVLPANSRQAFPPEPNTVPQLATSGRSPATTLMSRLAMAVGMGLLVFVIAWAPYLGLFIALAALLAGRVIWRVIRRLFERRQAYGPQSNDRLVAAVAFPWDLLASIVPCVGQAVLALVCATAAGGLVNLFDGLGHRTPYLIAAAVAMVVVWWGPGAIRSRHGIRVLATPLDRIPRGFSWTVIAILMVALCGAVLVGESYGTQWWPADRAFDLPIPFFTW